MAKEKDKGLTPKVEGEPPKADVVETPAEAVTPTLEELTQQLQDAQAKLTEATGNLATMEQNWKDAQRVASKHLERATESEIKREDLEELRDNYQLLTAVVARIQGATEDSLTEEIGKNKPNLLRDAEILSQQRKAERTGESFRKRVEAIGLTDKDDAYWEIKDLVESGKLPRAEIKLKKFEDEYQLKQETPVIAKPPEAEPPKSLSDEDREKLALEYLKEKGMLPLSTGVPSSGGKRSYTAAEIEDMSLEQYRAIKADIREGKIKVTE